MAEVRCPMCGKLNPAGEDNCRYCHARLKPVSSPSSGSLKGAEDVSGSEPDWLQQLRTDDPLPGGSSNDFEDLTGDPAGQDQAEAGDVPDWLARIRAKAQDEPDDSPDLLDFSDSEEKEPDWMQAFQQAESPSPSASSDDGDDWLSRLSGSESSPLAPSTAADDEPVQADLSDVFGSEESVSAPSTPAASDADWASRLDEFGLNETPLFGSAFLGSPSNASDGWSGTCQRARRR